MNWKIRMVAFTFGVGLAGLTSLSPSPGLWAANHEEEAIPEGPHVDFCPRVEQTEVHLVEYGFDYKPTLACTAEGPAESQVAFDAEDEVPDEVAQAKEKAELKTAIPIPCDDPDPQTICGVLPTGEELMITIQTDDPERYRGMTPSQFADLVYP